MAIKKITKRWLVNHLGVILVVLILLEIVGAIGIRAFYYNNVYNTMAAEANIVQSRLIGFSEDAAGDFMFQLRGMVENFSARDSMEMMAINPEGQVIFTSSGFLPDGNPYYEQYRSAVATGQDISKEPVFVTNHTSEKIMLVVLASPVSEDMISAIMFASSMELVDRQVLWLTVVIILAGAAILCFVVFSSSYFINSIVNPVSEVGDTAREIAQGNFTARLQVKTDDEIGELCDTINYMAGELGANEKMKNDFISSVSHELRTPLTAIKGWAETMESMGSEIDPETMQKGMRVINGETKRLANMVEELLDFSRLQSGRFQLNRSRMDLIAELSEAVFMFEERARREDKELVYDEPELMAPIFGDQSRLRQVFVNIIDNALKYSDPKDRVEVTAKIKDDQVIIAVKDTGLGIKAEDLPRVKEKFYKANSTRRGSGIGLAVADEIISMHGGGLTLDSQEGVGTTVTISLPLQKS